VSGKTFLIAWRDELVASEVGSSARLVGFILSVHMNGRGGSCFPGIRLLCKETRLSRQTVIAAVRELEAAGLITVKRGAGTRSSEYQAVRPSVTRNRPLAAAFGEREKSLAFRALDHLAVQSEEQRAPRERSEGTQRTSKKTALGREDRNLDTSTETSRGRDETPEEKQELDRLYFGDDDTPRGAYWEPNG
jgi:DNA-binding transcriptional regulator GbsR (MarR family)